MLCTAFAAPFYSLPHYWVQKCKTVHAQINHTVVIIERTFATINIHLHVPLMGKTMQHVQRLLGEMVIWSHFYQNCNPMFECFPDPWVSYKGLVNSDSSRVGLGNHSIGSKGRMPA